MCGAQCPICRTVIENPNEFIQPAPFVLRTILSELDFQCPMCFQTVKLHQLPQHQEAYIPNPTDTIAPTHNAQQQCIPLEGTVQGLAPLLRLHTSPIPATTQHHHSLRHTQQPLHLHNFQYLVLLKHMLSK